VADILYRVIEIQTNWKGKKMIERVINGKWFGFVETDEDGTNWWSDEDGQEFSEDELDKLECSI